MDRVSFSIFEMLNERQLEKLSKHFEILKFDAHAPIYGQLDYTDHIYGVMDGAVKTGIVIGAKEMVKDLISPGNFFGINGLTGQQRRLEFAQSLNRPTTVLSVPVRQIRALMHENEQFLQAVVMMVGRMLRQTETRLELLLTVDVRTRILHFLKAYIHENAHADHLETPFLFALTQQDIAHMIGAARQTVAIILNEMRKENLIDFSRKKFIIKDKIMSVN